MDQCIKCVGTNYYFQVDRWSFLDGVMLKKNRDSKFVDNSVVIITADIHTRDDGSPLRFNAEGLYGVSDHFPVVAEVEAAAEEEADQERKSESDESDHE